MGKFVNFCNMFGILDKKDNNLKLDVNNYINKRININ